MSINERVDRRTALHDIITVGLAFGTGAILEVRASANDVLNRPTPPDNSSPLISIILDGGISPRESFDAKEFPLSGHDSGIKTYAPDTGSNLVFSRLFPEMRSISTKLAVFRCVSSLGDLLFHAQDSTQLLLDDEGINMHDRIALHTRESGHPYYYVPHPHEDIGIKTNEQGAGLRAENDKFHTISRALAYGSESDSGEQILVGDQRLVDREALLESHGNDRIHGDAVSDFMSKRRFAYGMALRNIDLIMTEPNQRVKSQYGKYGLPLHYAGQLIKNGARSVAVRIGSWDFHFGLVQSMYENAPRLDKAITALIGNIESGEIPPCLVSCASEFGRSPSFGNNSSPGRDHFPISTCWLYGGYSIPGVYGETDSFSRPASEEYVIRSSGWKNVVFAAAGYPELVPDNARIPKGVLKSSS